MDRIEGMRAFAAVAEAGSFNGGARRLGIARALVSKRIAGLEARLGARLLNRTTRKLSLTGPGGAYLEHCRRILAEIDAAEQMLADLQSEPRGRLRVSAPVSFALAHLAPALPAFVAAQPQVTIDLVLDDRFVDLVEAGFDLALRIGRLADSTLIARRLTPVRSVVVAAPAYLARFGAPRTPEELGAHRAVHYVYLSSGTVWHLESDGRSVSVDVPMAFSANNGDALALAAEAGLGLAMLPTFIVHAQLRRGSLVQVLPGWAPPSLALHAVWPPTRHLPAKTRSFVEFLAGRFGEPPPWESGL